MNIITRIKQIQHLVLFIMLLFLMNSCGTETSAPYASSITIAPPEVKWSSGSTGFGCTSGFVDETTFTITVLDEQQMPMNDTVIFVELDLSPFTSSIYCLQLIDADSGTEVASPYRTKTGVSGTKNMRVRVNLGAEYKANMRVYSGSAFNSANIEVTKL